METTKDVYFVYADDFNQCLEWMQLILSDFRYQMKKISYFSIKFQNVFGNAHFCAFELI